MGETKDFRHTQTEQVLGGAQTPRPGRGADEIAIAFEPTTFYHVAGLRLPLTATAQDLLLIFSELPEDTKLLANRTRIDPDTGIHLLFDSIMFPPIRGDEDVHVIGVQKTEDGIRLILPQYPGFKP